MGLREIKKARTRKLISDLARDLFIEKGYEQVTVADIAKRAEVAVTTLFNYFPTKESIIFDLEEEIEIEILEAVRDRAEGETVLEALENYFLSSKMLNPPNKKIYSDFMKLIRSSPELSSYFRGMWSRYEGILAKEIRKQARVSLLEAECISHLVLEGVGSACHSPVPKEALNLFFQILRNGWDK